MGTGVLIVTVFSLSVGPGRAKDVRILWRHSVRRWRKARNCVASTLHSLGILVEKTLVSGRALSQWAVAHGCWIVHLSETVSMAASGQLRRSLILVVTNLQAGIRLSR